jgi:DnaJ domain
MIEAYPLAWPEGRVRTPLSHREPARFMTTFARARDDVIREVARLKKVNLRYQKDPGIIISTNIPLRNDGLPYANTKRIDDVGVAVYFSYKLQQRCFACDRWNRIEDNMQAISKTIEALRGIERWATGDMLQAAFTGFTALPAPNAARAWHEVLGVKAHDNTDNVRASYRNLASQHHPDRGGDHTRMTEINIAWQAFCKERHLGK